MRFAPQFGANLIFLSVRKYDKAVDNLERGDIIKQKNIRGHVME